MSLTSIYLEIVPWFFGLWGFALVVLAPFSTNPQFTTTQIGMVLIGTSFITEVIFLWAEKNGLIHD